VPPLDPAKIRTLKTLFDRLREQRSGGDDPNRADEPKITLEVITGIEGSEYVVRGKRIGTTGQAQLQVGQQVYVAWKNNEPSVILYHNARRMKGLRIFGGLAAGVVEELYIGPDKDIWFRNYSVDIATKTRPLLASDPLRVQWGEDRQTFFVETLDPGDSTKSWFYIFLFPGKPQDKILAPNQQPTRPPTLLALTKPWDSSAVVGTITATRNSITHAWQLKIDRFASSTDNVSFEYNPANPPAGLQIHSHSAVGRETYTEQLLTATEAQTLSKTLTLGGLLTNTYAGIETALIGVTLSIDRDLFLMLRVTFGRVATVKGDGNLTRTGLLPRAFHPNLGDNICSLLSENAATPSDNPAGSGVFDYPPTGPISDKPLSPFFKESHAFFVSALGNGVRFTTAKPVPELQDDSFIAIDCLADLDYNIFTGDDATRGMGSRFETHIFGSTMTTYAHDNATFRSGGGTSFENNCGGAQYFNIVPYGSTKAVAEAAIADYIAHINDGATPNARGPGTHQVTVISFSTAFVDDVHNVQGTGRVRGSIWNTAFPFITDLGDVVPDFDASQLIDRQWQTRVAIGVHGQDYNVFPVGTFGEESIEHIDTVAYTIKQYRTIANSNLPTQYRLKDARAIWLPKSPSTEAWAFLVVEKVVNTGTLSAPTWEKYLGAFIAKQDGTLVSTAYPFTLVTTYTSAGVDRLGDTFIPGLWDDGTQIAIIKFNKHHVLWKLSTLAQRNAGNIGSYYITAVASGASVVVATDLTTWDSHRLQILHPDFMYASREADRFFVKAWNYTTEAVTLTPSSGFPEDPQLTTVKNLLNLPGGHAPIEAQTAYQVINESAILLPLARFINENP
jgi:hypothetical protein